MKFHEFSKNGLPKIIHYSLIKFLEDNGFARMNFNGTNLLVRITDNIIYEVNEGDISSFVSDYLIETKELLVNEYFVKGLASYVNSRKLQLLRKIDNISDRDTNDTAWTYFKNVAVKVTATDVLLVPYSELQHLIWNTRILEREFSGFEYIDGQFSDFAFKLSKSDSARFLALQTALGYLQHRYNNPSICKAIILLDENVNPNGTTNGGSGKTLLYEALKKCKNAVLIEGKNLKNASRFKNQRISISTDIINYDDLSKNFQLEELYSMLTSGVIIEQKGKPEILLPREESPKIMVSSNYRVNGPGGSSDRRRRYEFEVANFFDDINTPVKTYGNLFFEEWDLVEWNRFDCFMLKCIQNFLKYELIEPDILNSQSKLENITCKEFVEFVATNHIEENVWTLKNQYLESFTSEFPELKDTTGNQLTRWMKEYAEFNGQSYEDRKRGENYEFLLKCA